MALRASGGPESTTQKPSTAKLRMIDDWLNCPARMPWTVTVWSAVLKTLQRPATTWALK